MGNRVRFTEGRVQSLSCPAGKKYGIHLDTETDGLGVRVTENGARSYVFEKRVNKRSMRVTIGDVGSWPLKKARQRARELTVMVEQGDDPRVVADQKTAQAEAIRTEAERADLVLREVWRAYIDAHKTTWGEHHFNDHIKLARPGGEPKKKHGGKGRTKPGPLASLMSLKLRDLTDDRVAEWLQRETGKRPTAAALAYRLLRAFIRWCNDTKAYKGIVSHEAYSAREVRRHVPTPRAKDGDCLQKEQLPAWFKYVRQLSNPIIAAYLQTLLLTGPRREELEALKWADVDFRWNSMVLHDKVEGDRTIPLSPYVKSLLSTLPRKNEWVFSSEDAESGHLEEPTKAHIAALEAGGLPHVTLHGLRRSFSTLSEWVEVPTGIVAQIQGHKPSAIAEKHYKKRPLDLLRMWHEKIEAWILVQAGVAFSAAPGDGRFGVVSADGTVATAS